MRFANIIYLNKINFPGKLKPEKKGKKNRESNHWSM